jgi:hypothetical protein
MTEGKPSCPSTKTESCTSEKKGCCKKWLMASVIAFVITFVYDWLVHGGILMDTYKSTASLWRPESEMQAMMPLCFAKHALMAVVFAALFMRWKCTQTFGALFSSMCPVRKGFYFGAGIGLLLGINAASAYLWQPIPQSLAISWLVAEVVKWGLTGGILAFLCSRCSKTKE